MKLVSVIFVASCVASTLAAERGLQTLSKKWNITGPSFTYDTLSFDLDYQVSDFIDDAMTEYVLYTSGCKEAGTAVPVTVLTSSKTELTGAYDADNNGNGVRDQKLTVGVNADTIAASDIYVEDPTVGSVTATIDFCVRYTLLLTDGISKVNFRETLVTLFVDLSNGFAIRDVNVVPADKLESSANQVYFLEGYQCDLANVALNETVRAATRGQGSVIRVCVEPDAEASAAGIKMRSLDEFTFTRDDISQEAIIGANVVAGNGLTNLACSNGVDVCVFETILFAAFYSSVGIVLGSGAGSMQFSTRRLRALQAEAAGRSGFKLDIGVDPGSYVLEGYQCDADNVALTGNNLTNTARQGSIIRICVKPSTFAVRDGIIMRSLDEFTFSKDALSQPAVTGNNQEATNGLTSLACSDGVDVCAFETVLFSDFYTSFGDVLGSGIGSLEFHPDVLQADRTKLATTYAFELVLGVVPTIDGGGTMIYISPGSGAARTSGIMVAAALVMAGAFALII